MTMLVMLSAAAVYFVGTSFHRCKYKGEKWSFSFVKDHYPPTLVGTGVVATSVGAMWATCVFCVQYIKFQAFGAAAPVMSPEGAAFGALAVAWISVLSILEACGHGQDVLPMQRDKAGDVAVNNPAAELPAPDPAIAPPNPPGPTVPAQQVQPIQRPTRKRSARPNRGQNRRNKKRGK